MYFQDWFRLFINFKDEIIFDMIGMLAIYKKNLVVQLGTLFFIFFWGEKLLDAKGHGNMTKEMLECWERKF